ncbi:MAG: hypothetical protein EOP86_16045, partial [Verrucomicrobiaceae bacterium]
GGADDDHVIGDGGRGVQADIGFFRIEIGIPTRLNFATSFGAAIFRNLEGITGSRFQGRITGHAERNAGNPPGSLICEIEGSAWITGRHTFLISPDDPYREGFFL